MTMCDKEYSEWVHLSISKAFCSAHSDACRLLPLDSVSIDVGKEGTNKHPITATLTVVAKSTGAFLYIYTNDGWYSYDTSKTFPSLQELIEDEGTYAEQEDEGEEGQLSLTVTKSADVQVQYEIYLHLCPITLGQLLGKLGVYLVSNIDYHNDGACTLSDIFHSGGYPYWRESFRACSVDSQGNLGEFTLDITSVISKEEATSLKVQQPFTSESIAIALEKFIVLMRKVKNALDAKATITTTGTILVEFRDVY